METFVLDIATPLTEAPPLPQHRSRLIDESTLEVDISRDESINRLFEDLSRLDIRVLSMRNKTNRLEQLFVRLVEGNAANGA
jgi:ABC-2 type transport system ATP-binding protein